MTANNNKFPSYQDISSTLMLINNLLMKFASVFNIDIKNISVSIPLFINIVLQVKSEKKKIAMLHANTSISEVRETSLYCYYILKQRPIIASEDFKHSTQINELFCIYLLFNSISLDCKAKGKKEPYSKMTDSYLKSLLYALSYGELSKEALYSIANAIRTFC